MGLTFGHMTNKDYATKYVEEHKGDVFKLPGEFSFMNDTDKGTVNLVCAQTGVGKSWYLIHLACALSLEHKVLYCSLENKERIDQERLSIICSNIKEYENCEFLYCNEVEFWQKKEYLDNKDEIANYDVFIIDGIENTIDETASDRPYETYRQTVKEIHKKFPKATIFMSWQLNRDPKRNEIPTLEQLAGSYATARLADTVTAIYKNAKGFKITANIKGRCDSKDTQAVMTPGKRFKVLHGDNMSDQNETAREHLSRLLNSNGIGDIK